MFAKLGRGENPGRVPGNIYLSDNLSETPVGEIENIGISVYPRERIAKRARAPIGLLLINRLKVEQTRREGCGRRCANVKPAII